MVRFCPIASGSKGNAIFVETENTRILIDAGISLKRLIEGLSQIGVGIDTIQAILITHEHIDHIQSVAKLSAKYQIPLFANGETAKATACILKVRPKFKLFVTGEAFQFGEMEVHSFSVPHDTVDPVGFAIYTQSQKIGICTDLGYATSLVKKKLEHADILYLEANHEEALVHACARPKTYKERVLSRQGHLSNQSCKALYNALKHPKLKKVYLAHLSEECNREELALKTVQGEGSEGVSFSIAYQHRVSESVILE